MYSFIREAGVSTTVLSQMFKSESIPHWLLVILAVGQTALLIVWRLQDTHQPISDLYFWIIEAVILIGIVFVLWWCRKDCNRDPSQLYIHYARYRWGVWPWQYRRVTSVLRSHMKNNSVNMRVSNDHLGDPKFGVPKTLTVRYSFAGFNKKVVLPEDHPDAPSRLMLPESELRKVLERMLSDFPNNEM